MIEKRWDLASTATYNFICATSDNTFPKKKKSFCFNHPHDSAAGLRSRKDWKFKIF
jgi:hypothetical protein